MNHKTPCKDCPERHPLCRDQCETYWHWKVEKAREAACNRQKNEEITIHKRDFDKEFWM